MATVLKQLKDLPESQDLMQQELEELRDVKDAAQGVAHLVEISGGDGDEPLTLVGRLRRVPESFERCVSTTTRQYVGHVLGLVKSYWPSTQFNQYWQETSIVADQIVESLNKPESP